MLKTCKVCESEFEYTGKNTWAIKYCSDQCRKVPQNLRLRILSEKYRKKHPDKVELWKKISYQKKLGTYRERCRINHRNSRRIDKWRVLTFYSKAKLCCNCCGEKEMTFLTIDHINGGGNKQRKELFGKKCAGGNEFYTWLIKNGYPDGFQVLCMNCNFAKGLFGECPHLKVIRPAW